KTPNVCGGGACIRNTRITVHGLVHYRQLGLSDERILEAIGYAENQWPTLVRYLQDGRLTIDNAPAEPALRPPAVGRRNLLQSAGDGGLKSAAVLLSVAASAKRHGVNPWAYVRHILSESAARPRAADFSDLLPDAWAQAGANP